MPQPRSKRYKKEICPKSFEDFGLADYIDPMTNNAPITQDVLTIPRKDAHTIDGRMNLVGLTRDGLREALLEAGTSEKQAKMRTGQIWQWVYHWGVRDFSQMTNLSKDYRALLAD